MTTRSRQVQLISWNSGSPHFRAIRWKLQDHPQYCKKEHMYNLPQWTESLVVLYFGKQGPVTMMELSQGWSDANTIQLCILQCNALTHSKCHLKNFQMALVCESVQKVVLFEGMLAMPRVPNTVGCNCNGPVQIESPSLHHYTILNKIMTSSVCSGCEASVIFASFMSAQRLALYK